MTQKTYIIQKPEGNFKNKTIFASIKEMNAVK